MSQLIWCTALLLAIVGHSVITTTAVDLVNIPGPGNGETASAGICLTQESRDAAIKNIRDSVQAITQDFLLHGLVNPNCGSGVWYRVAHLNMSNSSQHCPSVWREYRNTDGKRGCRRPMVYSPTCSGTFHATNRRYSRVCGRIIGHQIGGTDAFGHLAIDHHTIDSYYVYGVSVTHGAPRTRNHIWTLAAGITDRAHFIGLGWECPCIDPSHPSNAFPPSFVGNNYYCESGNPTDSGAGDILYTANPIWDGQQCKGQCCSTTDGQSPPWFTVELPNLTTDDIEVRICIPEGFVDDVGIHLLELYVQ